MPSGQQLTHRISKRFITIDGLPRKLESLHGLSSLVAAVFREIIDRLQNAQIICDWLAVEYMPFALPFQSQHREHWDNLLQTPLFLDDDNMTMCLNLKLAKQSDANPPDGDAVFYVRSFTMSLHHLRKVIDDMETNDIVSAELTSWNRATEYVTDLDTPLYIRYIGMSQHVNAWTRYKQDLSQRTDGLYGFFIDTVASLCPDVLRDVKIYNFQTARMSAMRRPDGTPFKFDPSVVDIREQILIALFGYDSLLNRQHGGKYVSYVPSDYDQVAFQRLGTSLFQHMRQYSAQPDAETQMSVAQWMSTVQIFANSNEVDLGTDKYPIDPERRELWAQQALPATVHGKVLACWYGDYVPLHRLREVVPFWSQDSRTPRMLKDFISRLLALEENDMGTRWSSSQLTPYTDRGLFPFVDYQYWPKHTELLRDIMELSRQYIEVTKPLVVVTLSKSLSCVVQSNFSNPTTTNWPREAETFDDVVIGSQARAVRDWIPAVGNLHLAYYTDPGELRYAKAVQYGQNRTTPEFSPQPNDCFIQIPSIHPGYDNYNRGWIELRRLLDMSMWKIVLTMDVAAKIVQDGQHDEWERKPLCEAIIEEVERRWTKAGLHVLFARIKSEYQSVARIEYSAYTAKDPIRTYKVRLHGELVPVSNRGNISIYWERPSGVKIRLNLSSRVNIQQGSGGKKVVNDLPVPAGSNETRRIRL